MNELVKITTVTINHETVNAVNARDLWKFLGSRQEFANWIKGRISEYGFEEGKDFLINLSKSHGRPSKEYIISLDMAKELAMVENNEQGRKVRQYFIEIEKQYRRSPVSNIAIRQIAEAMMPVLEERARLKMELNFARHFLPVGQPGEPGKDGKPKNFYRRGFYTSRNGKPVTALVERYDQPGLFDEIELKKLN